VKKLGKRNFWKTHEKAIVLWSKPDSSSPLGSRSLIQHGSSSTRRTKH